MRYKVIPLKWSTKSHDTIALRTWKRLAWNNIPPETPIHHLAHKRTRELDEGAHPELPTKKILVSKDDDTKNLLVEAAKQPRQEPCVGNLIKIPTCEKQK